MKNIIFFKDINFIGKDNVKVFSPYATKYFLFMVDDFSTMDTHNDFPFEKKITYFKENKYKTGFIFDDEFVPKYSVIGFSSYNFSTRKTQTKYLVYLGMYANEDGKRILAFSGNNGVPFESEAEVFTFKEKNMEDLKYISNIYSHNKDGEVVATWKIMNTYDNFRKIANGIASPHRENNQV